MTWVLVAAGFHSRGGMEKANAELARYLLRNAATVHLVAHEVDPFFRTHRGASVHIVPRPLGSFALGEFGLDWRGRRVAHAVRATDPDAVVVVNGGNCQWPDVNWVHYVHHAWTDVDARAPIWFKAKHRLFSSRWRRAERAAVQAARIVVANSEITRTHLLRAVGLRASSVRTVYLGSDPAGEPTVNERAAARQWLGLRDDQPAVAFVGALGLDRRKGFDTLWSAWTSLCAAPDWDAHLIVAGSGADSNGMRERAEQAGIASRVRLLGHSNRVPDLLAGVDLLVSPARYEPYGLNVQEAICRGLPAIVSRCAGVAERYPPSLADMLLNDPESVTELVGILRTWRAHMAAWKARIAPLGCELRSYGWDEMSRIFVETVSPATPQRHGSFRRAS